jgi:uncharacterized protein (DUF1800 family)
MPLVPHPAPNLPLTGAASATRRRSLLGATVVSALAPPWLLSACAGVRGEPHVAARDEDSVTQYRLANRLSWGANDAELERVRRLGSTAYIDEQLRAAAGPLPAEAQAQIDTLRVQQRTPLALASEIEAARRAGEALPGEDDRKAAQQAYQQELNTLAREAASRHLLRALYSPNQLLEQMQWFWFNHFNVHQYKGNIRALLGDYEERAIRPHALGRFRALLGAVTCHPAMLRYLDNEQNAAARINENHARELLELHTLGVDGGYTQRDVQELARVLTGHGVNLTEQTPRLSREHASLYLRNGAYEFNPGRHDFGTKALLGLSLRGRGAAELDEVLDSLALNPTTARFVSRKLARHWLAEEPSAAVVDAMVMAWRRSGGRIDSVLAVLVHVPEFTSPATAKFKDPVHYVVSAVRAAYGERVLLNTGPVQAWLNRMGEGLYNRPTPDGYPSAAAAWSSSGQMAARLDIARAIGSGSAGLFKADGSLAPPREKAAFPQLMRPIYWQVVRGLLAPPTREALDAAASAQDWNALYLSAPEFMYT